MKRRFAVSLVLVGLLAGSSLLQAEPLARVERAVAAATAAYEGQIEAVTETRMAAQVAGLITAVRVKAGDRVEAGQLLLEIDSSQAKQQQAAVQAQAEATRAQLHAINQELQRQQKLHAQGYVSQGALERIEAEQRATRAQLNAQQAQAQAAQVQTGFFQIRSPYDGIVIDVPAMQGDMAMPGMPLLTLFDPTALRVGASVPVNVLAGSTPAVENIQVLLGNRELNVSQVQQLPTADASSQTRRLRLELTGDTAGLLPGQSVKVHLQRDGLQDAARLFIPAQAVVRRAELTAVYVQSAATGKPLLRQVRLGAGMNGRVEVLSGLAEGEQVYLDTHAASKE